MKRTTTLTAMLATIALGIASFATATALPQNEKEKKEAQAQEQLQREAKITLEQARETALKRAPGNVESSELEREHSKLVYSFDIRNAKGTITEVQVSAITGRIVRVEHENKKQEADEKRHERREKTRKPSLTH